MIVSRSRGSRAISSSHCGSGGAPGPSRQTPTDLSAQRRRDRALRELEDEGLLKRLAPVRGKIARAWLAVLDDDGQVIADPILIDESILDTATPTFSVDGAAVLNLNATSAMFYWQRPIALFITNEDQQVAFPGDTGFDRIPTEVASKQVSWTRT